MPARVIAYHLILTAYGFWLPNDPRGSWSTFVRSWELQRFGPATKTAEKRSLANDPHDRALRLAAKASLVRTPVRFSAEQCRAVGMGFLNYTARSRCVLHACSILPTHVHLVVMRMQYPIEHVSNLLKGAATAELIHRNLHPFADQPYRNGKLPTPWTRHQWSCFLDSAQDIRRSIKYTENNPQKENKPPQKWNCVTPYA